MTWHVYETTETFEGGVSSAHVERKQNHESLKKKSQITSTIHTDQTVPIC